MEKVLADFRATVEEAAEQMMLIPEEQSEIPKAAGKWSAKEILGHLIDSAANNHQRFVRGQFTGDLIFAGYDQNQWVQVQYYNRASWPLLIQLWRAYNLHLLHVMSVVPVATRQQPHEKHTLDQIGWQPVSASDAMTLEHLMRDYIAHLKHHLQQIFS